MPFKTFPDYIEGIYRYMMFLGGIFMDELTQEQKYTIAKFYKLYMERSNAGQPEDKANDFKDSVSAQDTYFCDRDYHDFVENCKVLINNGYINGDVSGIASII